MWTPPSPPRRPRCRPGPPRRPQSAPQRVLFTLIRMNAKVAKDFDKGLAALDAAATGRAPVGA